MNTKYASIQEWYDDMVLKAKQDAQSDIVLPMPYHGEKEAVSEETLIGVIEELFPESHAPALLTHIKLKMGTFMNMGKYYKAEAPKGRRDTLDSILLVMAELFQDLRPYEIVVRLLYPHFNRFLDSLDVWYKDNKDRMYENRVALYSGIINA
jgi:hypothetical protein